MAICKSCGKKFTILTARDTSWNKCNPCLDKAFADANAERNPPAAAECYLWRGDHQDGPFTPGQIKSMWDSDVITADALYYYPALSDWKPVRSFCLNPNYSSQAVLLQRVVTEQKKTSSLVWRLLFFLVMVLVIVPLLYQCSQNGH